MFFDGPPRSVWAIHPRPIDQPRHPLRRCSCAWAMLPHVGAALPGGQAAERSDSRPRRRGRDRCQVHAERILGDPPPGNLMTARTSHQATREAAQWPPRGPVRVLLVLDQPMLVQLAKLTLITACTTLAAPRPPPRHWRPW